MSTPTDTTWQIDPHTSAKHEILRRYLGAWFPIIGAHNKRVVYIDGFCGPGRYRDGETGSPLIALEAASQNIKRLEGVGVTFLFTDEDADRIEYLKAELSKTPIPAAFEVDAVTGTFEEVLRDLLDHLTKLHISLAPTFAFIDPFGFKGAPFELVARLLKNPKTEVLINIMVDSINRFVEHPDEKTRRHIVELFGTGNVQAISSGTPDRITKLRLLYQEQLSRVARFVRYFEMRDHHGRIIYFLFFASNHPLGHTRMKEAFWKVDPSSGLAFSDATNPSQPILFEIDHTPAVATLMQSEFSGQRVTVGKVQKFIEEKSPYIARHMRAALKLLEESDNIHVQGFKGDGTKRRKKVFSEDVIIEF